METDDGEFIVNDLREILHMQVPNLRQWQKH